MMEQVIEDQSESGDSSGGAPAWVMTFADLMSLLMAFFVLLHSFAEMDLARFQELAESMKDAFGDKREVVHQAAQSPQRARPVDVRDLEPSAKEPTVELEPPVQQIDPATLAHANAIQERVAQESERMRKELAQEILAGKLDVEPGEGKITLRVQEVETFSSGSADLLGDFSPVLNKIRDALKQTQGQIFVAGHTDDVPIATSRYRSNWELSAARAVSVVHHLVESHEIDPGRVHVQGHADTKPLVPNDSPANRALNRRVEIVVIYGGAPSEGVAKPPREDSVPN
jgi:chemotaxis protein MotB